MVISLLSLTLVIILRIWFKKLFYKSLVYLKNLFLSVFKSENI